MTNDGSGGIFSAISGGIRWAVREGVEALAALLKPILNSLITLLTSTPYPSPASGGIFGAPPTNSTFYELYNVYHNSILPISTLLIMLALAVLLFTGIWSDKKKRVTAIRRLMFALPAILMWWYVAGWYLQFVQAFTALIVDIGVEQSATENLLISNPSDIAGGIVAALLLYIGGTAASLAVLGIYLIRWVALHLYMPGMPLLIAIWCIPDDRFSSWAKQLMQKFVPLSLVPIPVAFMLSMYAIIDFSTVAGDLAGELFDMISGLVILAIAAYLPGSMLSMNLQSITSRSPPLPIADVESVDSVTI